DTFWQRLPLDYLEGNGESARCEVQLRAVSPEDLTARIPMRNSPKLAVAALALTTLTSLALADENVYRQTLPSTVLVINQTGEGVATGSGVLVDGQRKWILTNYHVVQHSREVVVVFPTYDADGRLIAESSA